MNNSKKKKKFISAVYKEDRATIFKMLGKDGWLRNFTPKWGLRLVMAMGGNWCDIYAPVFKLSLQQTSGYNEGIGVRACL